MEIKTKFNLGDNVWVVHNSRAIEIEVAVITVNCAGVSYYADTIGSFPESECFATKDELLKHVAGE